MLQKVKKKNMVVPKMNVYINYIYIKDIFLGGRRNYYFTKTHHFLVVNKTKKQIYQKSKNKCYFTILGEVFKKKLVNHNFVSPFGKLF